MVANSTDVARGWAKRNLENYFVIIDIEVACFGTFSHDYYCPLSFLLNLDYPNYDVIAINDGSTDNTGEILDEQVKLHDKLRVIHLATNQGKAMGLNTAALMTDSEFLVCIDGDALLDRNALHWLMTHFIDSPRVGAVTGNPRIRNRSSLLGKIQVGEFSCIIGMINEP